MGPEGDVELPPFWTYTYMMARKLSHQEALEALYAGKLVTWGDYVRIPTVLFTHVKTGKAEKQLPEVSFYSLNEKGEANELAQEIDGFAERAVSSFQNLWVKKQELEQLLSYTDKMLIRGEAGPELRLDALRRSALAVTTELLDNPSPENIKRGVRVVNSFVYVLMREPKAFGVLSKLSDHDPYTVQHSVGAAVNSIILARKIGMDSESELNEAGLGGLLHDIGKVKVRAEVINKPGPLNDEEWEEMKGHPEAGYELVKNNPELTDRTKRAVLEHHEEREGTGYPLRVPLDETHIISRIVGISDIFNALTTKRSYAEARTPFDAFQLMREKLSHKMDPDLFKSLVMVYGGKLDQ